MVTQGADKSGPQAGGRTNASSSDNDDDDAGDAWTNGEPYIDDLFVSPDHHRQGIGLRLLQAAEGQLLSEGCETCVLAVLEAAKGSRTFYEVPHRIHRCCFCAAVLRHWLLMTTLNIPVFAA